MTQRKDTAHRPSQSDQEYVLRSDGTKVRNTAYVPTATTQGASHGGLTNLKGDISPQDRGTNYNTTLDNFSGDLDDYADFHVGNIESMTENLLSKKAPDYNSFKALYNLASSVEKVNVAKSNPTDEQKETFEKLQECGLPVKSMNNIDEQENSPKYTVDMKTGNDMNINFITAINHDGTLGEGTDELKMYFDDNDTGIYHASVAYQNGEPYKTQILSKEGDNTVSEILKGDKPWRKKIIYLDGRPDLESTDIYYPQGEEENNISHKTYDTYKNGSDIETVFYKDGKKTSRKVV